MYPITYEADYERNPDRLTTFFRLIVAIPWLIVAYIYLIAAFFTHIFAWVAVVILGRYPDWLYNFNSGVVRYMIRTYAWAYLQTDRWPPFGLADDPTYPVRVNIAPRAERQSRLKAFFRAILVLPMLIVYYGVNMIHTGAAIVAWLTIVFRGYQPAGVHNALTFTNSFFARVSGYFILLTDDYPPIGAEGPQVGDVPPAAISPAAPAPAVPAPEHQQQPPPPPSAS
jgi:Domain of unknown function (DUF4389)